MNLSYLEKLLEKKKDIQNKIDLYTGYLAFLESEIETFKQMNGDNPDKED